MSERVTRDSLIVELYELGYKGPVSLPKAALQERLEEVKAGTYVPRTRGGGETRQSILDRLRSKGYTGPKSYGTVRFKWIEEQIDAGTYAGKGAPQVASEDRQTGTVKVEGEGETHSTTEMPW